MGRQPDGSWVLVAQTKCAALLTADSADSQVTPGISAIVRIVASTVPYSFNGTLSKTHAISCGAAAAGFTLATFEISCAVAAAGFTLDTFEVSFVRSSS